MKLEIADFPVKNVKFGSKTAYKDQVLTINKDEVKEFVLKDKKVDSVDLYLAVPGEQTRIINVRDVVEPRVKVSGPSCVFPGVLGPPDTAGEGRTHKLSGVTVIPSVSYHATIPTGAGAGAGSILDMWGPGALLTPFGSTTNVVLMLNLTDDVTELEAHLTIQKAEFEVARYLAETTRHLTPDSVEVFELSKVAPSLPRVVYVLTCLTNWHIAHHSGEAFYGLPIRESLPTFIHPNELLDGAWTKDARQGWGMRHVNWAALNHPVVLGLLREHGKRLNFLGVVLQRTRFETQFGKHLDAQVTSQLIHLLGADGAIISRQVTSGNNFMDMMMLVQACEKRGIKTVFATQEWGGRDGTEMPLMFFVPEADAIVSTGSLEREVYLPAPAKVIGAGDNKLIAPMPGSPPYSPWTELTLSNPWDMCNVPDWWGHMNLTCRDY